MQNNIHMRNITQPRKGQNSFLAKFFSDYGNVIFLKKFAKRSSPHYLKNPFFLFPNLIANPLNQMIQAYLSISIEQKKVYTHSLEQALYLGFRAGIAWVQPVGPNLFNTVFRSILAGGQESLDAIKPPKKKF